MAKAKYEQWLEPDGLLRIQGWARDGLTDEQIARNMGISRSTLNEWRAKYPDMADTLKKTKDVVDREVENALLKEALKGNVTALIFWLKNRKPTVWRDKVVPDDTTAIEKLDEILSGMRKDAERKAK